jgi:hypothetical protein
MLLCIGTGFGQERPSAILIDEHGEISCDDTLGRIDIFFSELQRAPSSTGLIVISNTPENKARGVWRQAVIGRKQNGGVSTQAGLELLGLIPLKC